MSRTIKRISLCLTKEARRQLDDLCDKCGESPSEVLKRALQLFYFSLRFPNVPLATTRDYEETEGDHHAI